MPDFLRVRLHASARSLPPLAEFYGNRLGFELLAHTAELATLATGSTRLELATGRGRPFYHFALLLPGNRFDEAFDWVSERVTLLPGEGGNRVFEFAAWEARACYFHDPAGNIVELVAHRGVGETSTTGRFTADEVLGFSELGLVGDAAAMAGILKQRLDLELWDGELEGPAHLGFVGEQARTLILSPPGRPWLPTGQPAERHPVEAVFAGPPEAEAELEGSLYRVSRTV